MNLLSWFDLVGTFVFAISGTLAAAEKRFDFFGAVFAGFLTAVGGGTIRDVLLGAYPLAWVQNLNYLYIIITGVLTTFLLKKYIAPLRKTMFLFDTIGIGVFTIIGLQKALTFGVHPIIAIMMGTISAVFGGVLRDTFSNEVPLIFRKEIYATACILGGFLFLILDNYLNSINLKVIITILFVISIRIIAIRFKLSLPRIENLN
jgi:uncharacterized membrane protein YeiH